MALLIEKEIERRAKLKNLKPEIYREKIVKELKNDK
jgi:hypothetical protein